MNQATDIYGAVFAGASAVTMARVAYADETLITQSDIASITYSIEESAPCGVAPPTSVEGHTGVSVPVASAVSDTLLTDAAWDADGLGYNFRHEVDVTTSPAFSTPGNRYTVRYVLTPTAGQPIILRFEIEAA